MNKTICPEDYSFGPQTSPRCRNGLDLTLVFEESILGLAPASLMITAAIARLSVLARRRLVIPGNSFYDTKALHLSVLVLLRFILLLLWTVNPPIRTSTSIAAAGLFFVESFAFVALSKLEHSRSIRPSTLLNLYYLLSLGFEIIRIRTLIKLQFDTTIVAFCAADMAVQISLLILESQDKRAFFSTIDSGRPPQETSGILSRSVFWWLNSLLVQGYREVLTLNDLFPLDEELFSEETFERFEAKWNSMSDITIYRLPKTIVLCLCSLFLAPILPILITMAFIFAQPFLVEAMLNFVSSSNSTEYGYLIVAGYAATFIGKSIFTAFYTHQLDRFVTMVRGCLVHVIYNQTLKLDMKEAAGGESLTLMSADVERVVKGFGFLHDGVTNATIILICLGLLYKQLGLAFLAPLIFSAILSYLSGTGSAPYIRRQKLWLEATEQRLGFTASVISAMKGVKTLGLVKSIDLKIRNLRNIEVERAKKVRLWMAVFTLLQTLSRSGTRWITYTVFGILALFSSSPNLNTSVLFTSLTILNIFMDRLEIFLRNMPTIASSFGCLRRIESFLLLETKRDNRFVGDLKSLQGNAIESGLCELQDLDQQAINRQRPRGTVISIKDLSIGWTREQIVLHGIDLDIPTGVTMVVGPVGSGKSTLMHTLLGETVTHKGFLSLYRADGIAFCAQTPWLINKTIQQNILGTSIFDGPWYLQVLKACALLEDFKLYSSGDRTLVGSKGITLSGGQKQRIALARAVYAKKPITILDDVFSGLDPITEEVIFRSLFGVNGLLIQNSRTAVLATHGAHLLSKADTVILLGNNGEVIYQGSQSAFPTELISKVDLPNTSECADPGKVAAAETAEIAVAEDFMPRFHSDSVPVTVPTDLARQTGDPRIYGYYLRTLGIKHALLFVVLGAICMGFTPAQTLWLDHWASDQDKGKIGYYLGIYSIFFVGEIALTSVWIWHVFIYPLTASSIKLHHIQLNALMSATMSFFSSTDTGVTTNRFSQDLMLIDNELPLGMVDFVEYVYNNLYSMILIAISTAYIIPTFPIMLFAFYMIQRFYLRTSRQVRFLDLETKSPLYTNFIETFSGLATIRSFGWEEHFESKNRAFLQASQRPVFLLMTIQRWLTLVLNLIVSALAILLAILAVELRHTINPGFLGLALVNVTGLGLSLQSLVTFWTLLETSIGAVSRIKSFSEETPSESPQTLPEAPRDWLSSGEVDIQNVTASHSPNSDPVIRDVSLNIAPGERVGICGRSGSGKSSLLGVLLRLLDINSGSVLMDGTDISSISINQIRESLNTLSQDTFFLRGTIRENLATPSSPAEADERLQFVLTRTGLWNKVATSGGLDVMLDAEELFSHGERQLFCLARAMLNDSKILLLDEFTSSVDVETDRAMQKIIREDFKGRTVIAVAHRLETVLDFDRIVVMDQGCLVEDGAPSPLLQSDSAFRRLYEVYRNERMADV